MKFRTSQYLSLAFLFAGLLGAALTAHAQLGGPGHPFTLQNYVTGYCLGVSNNSTNSGAGLVTWQCNGTSSQRWFQGDATADGSLAGFPAYTLVPMVGYYPCRGCTFQVAGVEGGLDSDGQFVITWTEDYPTNAGVPEAVDNQGWAMEPITTKNGYQCYQIQNAGVNRQTAYNLGVQDGSTNEGTPIVVWQDTDYPASTSHHQDQIWCLVY